VWLVDRPMSLDALSLVEQLPPLACAGGGFSSLQRALCAGIEQSASERARRVRSAHTLSCHGPGCVPAGATTGILTPLLQQLGSLQSWPGRPIRGELPDEVLVETVVSRESVRWTSEGLGCRIQIEEMEGRAQARERKTTAGRPLPSAVQFW
jgi:hypothetical protein